MTRRVFTALGLTLSLGLAGLAGVTADSHAADTPASRADAQALVRKAVAFIKANGADKGHAAINDRQGDFVDRDLYIVVYGLQGRCWAHGANPSQIGRDLLDLTDIDGKYFVKERVALARNQPAGFWHDYRFMHPLTKKIAPKVAYCERLGDSVVCGGVYR